MEEANEILLQIGQAALTEEEEQALECMPHASRIDLFYSLLELLYKRSGEGLAVEKLKALALLEGYNIREKKHVFNNIFLGAPL